MSEQHGGYRPGSGRKPGFKLAGAAHRTRRVILLNDAEHQLARELGEGNISAGIRRALAAMPRKAQKSAASGDATSSP
jgi:hypothetical protein